MTTTMTRDQARELVRRTLELGEGFRDHITPELREAAMLVAERAPAFHGGIAFWYDGVGCLAGWLEHADELGIDFKAKHSDFSGMAFPYDYCTALSEILPDVGDVRTIPVVD